MGVTHPWAVFVCPKACHLLGYIGSTVDGLLKMKKSAWALQELNASILLG